MPDNIPIQSPTLAQKLAKVRSKMGSLSADKVNSEQKYKYISADKILEIGGDFLSKSEITVFPNVTSISFEKVERPVANGQLPKAPRIDATVIMAFTVTDGVENYGAQWIGVGSDYTTPDKAAYKAITSGHKYFLMKLLLIGIGNEDSEHNEEQESEKDSKETELKEEVLALCTEITELGASAREQTVALVKTYTPDGRGNPNTIKDYSKRKELWEKLIALRAVETAKKSNTNTQENKENK